MNTTFTFTRKILLFTIAGILICATFTIPWAFYRYSSAEIIQKQDPDIRGWFENEESYIHWMTSEVTIPDVQFTTVTVSRGDNFWLLAKRHGVNIDSLIGSNPWWQDLLARVGQKVLIPSRKGVVHFIWHPDQMKELAERYDVPLSSLQLQKLPRGYRYRLAFSDKDAIKPLAVFIPDTKPKTETMTTTLARSFELREMFTSPLGGRFSSFFGRRRHPVYRGNRYHFHNGIDIAARYGTLVGAARGGRVTFTGWNGGYGKAVIITHDNGYRTLYGHLSRIMVQRGQKVKKGQLIGRVGSTGLSTGPHLHFTLWHNGTLLNPMEVLW